MTIATQLTFRDMQPTTTAEALVRDEVARLDDLAARIRSCRVVITAPHRTHRKTSAYRVRIDVSLPGGRLVADSGPDRTGEHEELPQAVRNAFEAITRRVQDYVSRRRERANRGATIRAATR